MTDNPLREYDIPVCGSTFKVRATAKLIARVETKLNVSAYGLGLRWLKAEVPLTEQALVLSILLQDEKDAPTFEQVLDSLFEDGFLNLLNTVGGMLTVSLAGSKEHARKAAEAAKGAPEDPPKAKGRAAL